MVGSSQDGAPSELSIEVNGDQSVVRLEPVSYRVGRAATNQLSFPGVLGLSREHLILEPEGARWVARDLGSKTGLWSTVSAFPSRVFCVPGTASRRAK